MVSYNELYLWGLVVAHGCLFGGLADEGYDMSDFAVRYMNSMTRAAMDNGDATQLTMLSCDIIDSLKKEGIEPKRSTELQHNFMNKWIGETYCYIQWITGLPSSEVVKRVTYEDLSRRYGGLHDRDLIESSLILIYVNGLMTEEIKAMEEYEEYFPNMRTASKLQACI